MSDRTYRFGPFQLDLAEQVLLREGRTLPLKPKVFEVLAVLIENRGRTVCKDELMKRVWPDSFVEEGNLAVCVFEIRKALKGDENTQCYIETIPRRGYRFVASVTDTPQPTTSHRQGAVETLYLPVARLHHPVISRASIAVLPFKVIGKEQNDYLSLGIADALITRLSNLRQVTVRPTSSVRRYVAVQDAVLAGKELGVEWVLDGSVQKSRNRIRLTVQLVSVRDAVLLWAEKFDEKFTDVFAVEDSVSQKAVSALAMRLTCAEMDLLTKRFTQDAGAYEAYLKGRYFLEKRTTEGCNKGIRYFEHAIAIDPNYALPYAGLAACYTSLSTILPSQDYISLAERTALKSLELDAELVEAHVCLGYIKTRKWDWLSAETEFKTAIELNPNYGNARATYALYLAGVGRSSEALAEISKALALDPLSLTINSQLGSLLYLARQYQQAMEQLRRTIDLDPSFALTHFNLGYVLEALGEYEEALKEYHLSQTGLGNVAEFTSCIGRIHAFCGRREGALLALDELKQISAKHYVQPTLIALVHLALEDTQEAFRYLEQAYVERDEDLCLLRIDPRLDSLRGDPRFDSLLERVGLTNVPERTSSD